MVAATRRMHSWFGLLGWLAACLLAAAIGATASVQAASFYQQLTLPSWAPPAHVFGPVWSVLYVLMALAAWVAWRTDSHRARPALTLFIVQLAVNAAWSWLFFGWHMGAAAFIDILLLCALVLVTLVGFWRLRPLAGLLLTPYLVWISFAAVLNFSVWRLNPVSL